MRAPGSASEQAHDILVQVHCVCAFPQGVAWSGWALIKKTLVQIRPTHRAPLGDRAIILAANIKLEDWVDQAVRAQSRRK